MLDSCQTTFCRITPLQSHAKKSTTSAAWLQGKLHFSIPHVSTLPKLYLLWQAGAEEPRLELLKSQRLKANFEEHPDDLALYSFSLLLTSFACISLGFWPGDKLEKLCRESVSCRPDQRSCNWSCSTSKGSKAFFEERPDDLAFYFLSL